MDTGQYPPNNDPRNQGYQGQFQPPQFSNMQPGQFQQPYYPPQYYPQRTVQKRFLSRRVSVPVWAILLSILLCLLLLYTSILWAVIATRNLPPKNTNGSSQSSIQADSATTPTATMYQTPKTTPTSKPSPTATTLQGPTILGGNISDFLAKFGPPTNQSNLSLGDYHFQQYPGSYVDYLRVGTDVADGTPYNQHTMVITVQSQNQEWSIDKAQAVCSSFIPADSVYKRQVTFTTGGIPTVDKIYYSASLKRDFPTSRFQDAQQNPTTPGLFDIQYLLTDHNTVDSCSIAPGTQGTQ